MLLPPLRELLRYRHVAAHAARLSLPWAAWALAGVWCVRTRTLLRRFDEVPNLSEVQWDLCPAAAPSLVVIVPAKDEEASIAAAMLTLIQQDYPWLRIVAVNDRSADGTGAILDGLAERHPERLSVLHLTDTAEGWIAKTFAMETAVLRSQSQWILFTDADVFFSPSLLRRALTFAVLSGADHLVVPPTPLLRNWGERYFTAFLSVLGLWVVRPWRVGDPASRWDAVGAGAFNLIRREAWEELGGFAPQRLAVVEDLTLARRVRAAGMRQRIAFAPGLVLLHWAQGALGIVRGMTKNLFAMCNFRLWMAGAVCVFVGCLFLLPVAGLFWVGTLLPCVVIVVCLALFYRTMSAVTGISPAWGWLAPWGALTLLWAMLRSVTLTLARGGVRWRDTAYSLRDLRRHNSPFAWELEAARERQRLRRDARLARRQNLRREKAARSKGARLRR